MFRSSLRAIAFLALPVWIYPQVAPGQPQTAVDWLRDAEPSPDALIAPSPEPGVGDSSAQPRSGAQDTGDVASDLAAAVIGVDRLPPLGRGASPAIWNGSSPAAIAEAAEGSRPTPIRTANLLLRELLSTPVDPDTAPVAASRADALLRMGAVPEALATAHAAAETDAAALDTVTRAALLYGHGAAPCRQPGAERDEIRLTGFAGVFCEAYLGSASLASVRLEVERDLGEISEREASLLDAMIHPELAEFAAASGSDGAQSDYAAGLMLHLGLPVPEGFVREAPVRQIWRFVEDSDSPSPQRLPAMARLESAGLLDTPSFRSAVLHADPDGSDEFGVWTALLLQMADTRDADLFGRLVEAGLKLGRRQAREAMAARLLSLPARVRTPGTGASVAPGVMRRTFLLAQDPDTALLWLSLPAAPETAMLFSIALPDFEAEWDPEDEADLAARFAEDDDLRAGHILASLEAFGLSRRSESIAFDDSPEDVEGASAGETALLALGRLEAAPVAPGRLRSVLGALDRAGFADRARQIAVEVILLGS